MTRLAAALLTCLSLLFYPTDLDAQTAEHGAPSANDLAEFTRLLSDPALQTWITAQAKDAGPVDHEARPSMRAELVVLLDQTRTRLFDLGRAMRALPNVLPLFSDRWNADIKPGNQVRGLTFVIIFLFVGAGLEWLFRQYTNPLRLRLELEPVTSVRRRLTAASMRTAIAATGLVIFALGSIGAFVAFTWPPILEALVLNLLIVVFAVRAFHTLNVLFLAPRVPELRLLPLGNALAKHLAKLLLVVSGVYVLCSALADVYDRIAGGGRETVETLAVSMALSTVSFVATLAAIVIGFRRFAECSHNRLDRAAGLWRLYLCFLSVLVFAAVLLAHSTLAWTLTLVGLLLPTLKLLKNWVDTGFDAARPPLLPKTLSEDGIEMIETIEPIAPYESYQPIAQRLVRFTALVSVGLILAMIWDMRLFERAAAQTVSGRALAVAIDSAVALLLADLVWVWASSAIDRRLAAYVPPMPGTAPGPEARMATLLPLLRVVLMVTLLAMVTMSILSSLGVNIAPILAGAGVVGIAIGFGAQSLVKDVVSGIFFLIDDAFRVGEYVEIDQLRGTVEKISIRSLQIRHHRGAVHTLPFGELRHLTNHSRDWVIMKLEFRVPFDTDLQLVKKLIKQIGATMKEHEEYGPSILETLKSQGVRRMEEFNMVVGVKFMTRPGEQWLVRRDAYQMVRDAFDANGIRMAERNVKVEVAGADNMTDAERAAVAGAAQQAAERAAGPPAPIPDEP